MLPLMSFLTGLKAAEPNTSAARHQCSSIVPSVSVPHTKEREQTLSRLEEFGCRDLVVGSNGYVDEALLERVEEGAAGGDSNGHCARLRLVLVWWCRLKVARENKCYRGQVCSGSSLAMGAV